MRSAILRETRARGRIPTPALRLDCDVAWDGRRTAAVDRTFRDMPAAQHPFDDRFPSADGERRTAHPLPMRRRDFLKRSAMAVAGATLFSCTGGRVIPRVEPA